jgi:hypothetical protein
MSGNPQANQKEILETGIFPHDRVQRIVMEYWREVDGGQRCGKSGITDLHRFASSSSSCSSSTPLQVKGIHFSPFFFF